jgi:hypothetical protein
MWALRPGPQLVGHATAVVEAVLLARALRRVDRLVDRRGSRRRPRRIGRPGEVVAAAGPADAVHEAVPAQLAEQLLEVRQRDLLPLGDGR